MLFVSEELGGDKKGQFLIWNKKTNRSITGFTDELYDLWIWLTYRLELDQKAEIADIFIDADEIGNSKK